MADTKISGLNASAAVAATDTFPVVQAGVTVKATAAKMKTFVGVGTTTNDDAAAGSVGEIISSNVATPGAGITSATPTDITTISLTAGDWDVWGNVAFIGAAGTTMASIAGCISTTSATFPTAPNAGGTAQIQGTLGVAATQILPVGALRISVAVTTTIYLVGAVTFAVSTATAYGYIAARRAR